MAKLHIMIKLVNLLGFNQLGINNFGIYVKPNLNAITFYLLMNLLM